MFHDHEMRTSRFQTPLKVALLPAIACLAALDARAYVVGPPFTEAPIVVSTASGDQLHAGVSGDWVVYSSVVDGTSEVRYHDLRTGTDQAIPSLGGQDFLSAIDGTTVVYTHLTAAGFAINGFDLATGEPPVELDPVPGPQRSMVAIAGETVAWEDYGPRGVYPEIAVYDRVTGVSTLLTSDLFNFQPRLSPDGRTVVWTRCAQFRRDCDVWQATLADGVWSAEPLAADPAVEEAMADTDGEVVVYVRGAGREEGDVAWRPAGGGSERVLGLPGAAQSPRISGRILAFSYLPPAGAQWEIWVYDRSRDTLRQATFGPQDALLPDLFVSADGRARLAWSEGFKLSEYDVYARTFRVPGSTPVEELEVLVDLVAGFDLPHGITTSLTAKLSAAIAAIEAGDFVTACTKLGDFESQVRAQSGKALTWDQAADLLAAAEEVRSLLGC